MNAFPTPQIFDDSATSPPEISRDFAAQNDVLPSGTMLQNGAFIVREVLGRGGFGVTYRADDVRNSREIALKELFTPQCRRAANSDFLEFDDETSRLTFDAAKTRFLEQARVLEPMRHANIVRVFSVFEENATAYLAMELLRGETLLESVQRRGALPENDALDLLEKIGDALETIHRLGFLHLDIKPENMVQTREARVVLMDFDLAQKLHRGAEFETRPLDATLHCGTPGYAPVEQYSFGARFSPATDIYALGATLFHFVSGRAPVPSLERAHDFALNLPSHLSENVRHVLEKSLQIEIANRPQNVRAFREILTPPIVQFAASPAISHDDFVDLTQSFSAPISLSQNANSGNFTAQNPNFQSGNTGNSGAQTQNSSSQNGNSPIANAGNSVSRTPNLQTTNAQTSGAQNLNLQAQNNRVWRVEVAESSTRSLTWPAFCPCCGAPDDDNFAALKVRRARRKWLVLHCDYCVQHANAVKSASVVGALGMSGGLVISLAGFLMANWFLGVLGLTLHFVAMLFAILKSLSADAMKTPECRDKSGAVSCRKTNRRRTVFQFMRREYADEFRVTNGAKRG